MNIKELIQSTNRVKNRGKRDVFSKKFGSIYLYNKTVQVPKGGGVIVVNMMIGGVTDMIKVGGKRTPIAYHKVSLAINSVEAIETSLIKVYSPSSLHYRTHNIKIPISIPSS